MTNVTKTTKRTKATGKPQTVKRSRPAVLVIQPAMRPGTETVVPFHENFRRSIRKASGFTPSKTSIHKWMADGYPVYRGGPRVKVPYFTTFKKPMTTSEALARFVELVVRVEGNHRRGPQ